MSAPNALAERIELEKWLAKAYDSELDCGTRIAAALIAITHLRVALVASRRAAPDNAALIDDIDRLTANYVKWNEKGFVGVLKRCRTALEQQTQQTHED